MPKAKKTQSAKSRNHMYTQQLKSLSVPNIPKLVKLIEDKLAPERYALIVHDRDTNADGSLKEPHVHIMLSFKNARSPKSIAKILGDKPQYVEMWKGNSANGYAYLTHTTDNAKHKFQYPPSDVLANFDYEAELKLIEQGVLNAKSNLSLDSILNSVYEGIMSKKEAEKCLSGAQYGKIHHQLDKVHSKRLQRVAEKWREKMIEQGATVTVFWLYGKSGTGKTSFAKVLAKRKGSDYFVTGSSRDLFQSYEAGQHSIIFEELRPKVLHYEDLLRVTDPRALDDEVMAPSRYSDKAIAADLIIVTSPYCPRSFYDEHFRGTCSNLIDRFDQLLRRISLTIMMDDSEIYVAQYDDIRKVFIPDRTSAKYNPYSASNRSISPIDQIGIFEEIFGDKPSENIPVREEGK